LQNKKTSQGMGARMGIQRVRSDQKHGAGETDQHAGRRHARQTGAFENERIESHHPEGGEGQN